MTASEGLRTNCCNGKTTDLHVALKLLKMLVCSYHFMSSSFPCTFIEVLELAKTHYFFIEHSREPVGTYKLIPVCCKTEVTFLGCCS